MIKITFENNGSKKIDFKDLEFIDAGQQGAVYKYRCKNGKEFVLKFHDDEKIPRKLKIIKDRSSKSDSIPESLKYRAFPVGSGNAKGSDIQMTENCDLYITVFNWVNGQNLGKKLKIRDPNLDRKKITKHILEGLIFLENIGIVHCDLFPTNFLIDNNNIPHFIDLEGGGILNKEKNDWDFTPTVLGTPYPGFGRPPDRFINQYTDRWYGLNLIFILLTGFSPFFFLQRIDEIALKELSLVGQQYCEKCEREGGDYIWPPPNVENIRYFNKNCSKNIVNIRNFLKKKQRNLINLCYNTFIRGFDNPKLRETFNRIYHLLGF